MLRTYSELRTLSTFHERYEYLSLRGTVGQATFGYDRWLNQRFYTSREWRQMRNAVIVRDNGCDLAVEGFDIFGRMTIHHMNPMNVEQLMDGDDDVLNPEFLISTTHQTHNAIHYGDPGLLPKKYLPRRAGDTRLW